MNTLKTMLMALALIAAPTALHAQAQTEVPAAKATDLDQKYATDLLKAGADAPDITLNTIDGKPFALKDLRGRYVVLDFWGIWCKWCVKGIPEMKEYYSKYASKMEIVSIDVNDDLQELKDYVRKEGMTWTHISDDTESENSLCQQYQVQGFPTKIIIDPQGNIVEVYVGEVPEFYEKLNELLN